MPDEEKYYQGSKLDSYRCEIDSDQRVEQKNSLFTWYRLLS